MGEVISKMLGYWFCVVTKWEMYKQPESPGRRAKKMEISSLLVWISS